MRKAYGDFGATLKSLLPADDLETLGRAVRFLKRLRSIVPDKFVFATVLSRLAKGRPGFAEARHQYRDLCGAAPYPRPFQMRFKSSEAVSLFQGAFEKVVRRWHDPRRNPLQRYFSDVIAIDSSFVQLDERLGRHFPGIRNMVAAVKVVFAVSVFGRVPLFARLAKGTKSDTHFTPDGRMLKGKKVLWLFDKGFVKYSLLRRLSEAGQDFLCPMRKDGRAKIVAVHDAPAWARKLLRADPSRVELRDLLPSEKRIGRTWDLRVRLRPNKGPDYRSVEVRLVIVPGPDGKQRPYLTSLAPSPWKPEIVREVYRLRWQVELVFKELKQDLSMEAVPTKDPHAARCFIWASLIALAVSRVMASALEPLALTAGLVAKLRPALLTRALRGARFLLARIVSTACRAVPESLALALWAHLSDAASACAQEREDSIARIIRALPARA